MAEQSPTAAHTPKASNAAWTKASGAPPAAATVASRSLPAGSGKTAGRNRLDLSAVDGQSSVILLHPPLRLAGVSIRLERGGDSEVTELSSTARADPLSSLAYAVWMYG